MPSFQEIFSAESLGYFEKRHNGWSQVCQKIQFILYALKSIICLCIVVKLHLPGFPSLKVVIFAQSLVKDTRWFLINHLYYQAAWCIICPGRWSWPYNLVQFRSFPFSNHSPLFLRAYSEELENLLSCAHVHKRQMFTTKQL